MVYFKKIKSQIERIKLKKHNSFGTTNHFGLGTILYETNWGKYSGCNANCNIAFSSIGNYCSIAKNVIIGGRNHLYRNFTSSDLIYLNTKEHHIQMQNLSRFNPLVIIGHDVWIGNNVIINSNITVGTGSVIAAGSVITKDIKPYSIVGGNPGKLIKFRFDEETIRDLKKSKWFDLDLKNLLNYREKLENLVNFQFEEEKGKIEVSLND